MRLVGDKAFEIITRYVADRSSWSNARWHQEIVDALRVHANETLERAAKVIHEHKLRVSFGLGIDENTIQVIYQLYDDLGVALLGLKE